MVDAFEGGRSGMDVTDKNGLSTSMKQYSSEQKINPDDIKNGVVAENSFNDYREDNDSVKILRYRYRFNKKDGKRYLDWSPFYSASDYNFYNEDDIDFQILHSGINGTVRGIEDQDEIKKYLEK